MGTTVFISYKRNDIGFEDELYNWISEQEGFSAWYDRRIIVGKPWDDVINNQIKHALCVVVILTPAALQSDFVTYEWTHALELGIPVFQLLFAGVSENDIPPKLLKLQRADFSHPDRSKWQWDKLLEALQDARDENDVPSHVERAEKDAQNEPDQENWLPAMRRLYTDTHPQSFKALERLLHHTDPEKSIEAALLLAQKLDYKGDTPIEGLQKALARKRPKFEEAAEALGKIGSERAVKCLIEAFNETLDGLRQIALLKALGYTKHKDASVFLQDLILKANTKYRLAAIDALGENGDPDAAPLLLNILQDNGTTPTTKINLLYALPRLSNSSVVPELVKISDSYPQHYQVLDSDIMFALLRAIGAFNTNEGNAALKKYLNYGSYTQFKGIITDELKRNGVS